jgi:hypothetical protein
MDIRRSSSTETDLLDEAHALAEDTGEPNSGILKSTASGEALAWKGEFHRNRCIGTQVESVKYSPVAAALLLLDGARFGEVWGEDYKLITGGDYDAHLEGLLAEHLPSNVKLETGWDSGYRYIDDMSRRGGLIYKPSDYHRLGHRFTRPSVQEDPEPYIEALIRADQTIPAVLLGSTAPLEERGFDLEGEYTSSMHTTETNTSPEKKREELSAEGFEVVIFTSGSKQNPFRTEFQVWARPEDEKTPAVA